MYSVKPGRGPSFGGAIGGIIGAVLGVAWTIGAISMGAPPVFGLFGVVFVLLSVGGAVYNLYNATSKNRFSHFDITTPNEEEDPLAPTRFTEVPPVRTDREDAQFCTACGTRLEPSFRFCPKCGRGL